MIEFQKNITNAEKEEFLKDTNLCYKDIARITGFTYNSVKKSFRPSNEGNFPRWFNLVIHVNNLKK